ncbi:MAG: methyltransferase domain-containing protein [Oligoflexia bacterium]|nr:methyltransferase domain-containing protein [Oligoflexia bacterium]
MDNKTFARFQELIYQKSGINLNEGKETLVQARIGKRMRALGLNECTQYLRLLESNQGNEEWGFFLDAISTNVTHFFRESEHFDFLKKILNVSIDEGQTKFRIWSAASSSGEEPYSMIMTAANTLNLKSLDFKILATDISSRVLEIAKKGQYHKDNLKNIPVNMQGQNYLSLSKDDYNQFVINETLKRFIVFSRINLSSTPFPMKGPFDIVFCRNVMIYFDNHVRAKLLREIHRLLRIGGYLMVGHSESLSGLNIPLEMVQPSIYLKRGS